MSQRTFTFQITPDHDPDVSRTIEFKATQSLEDVHGAIQAEFKLNDEHPFSFYLNNQAFDCSFEYTKETAPTVTLGSLPLRPNKRILYLFDYVAKLHHEMKFLGEGVVEDAVNYPRTIESIGEAPEQGWLNEEEDIWDEEDGWEDEDEGDFPEDLVTDEKSVSADSVAAMPKKISLRKVPKKAPTETLAEAPKVIEEVLAPDLSHLEAIIQNPALHDLFPLIQAHFDACFTTETPLALSEHPDLLQEGYELVIETLKHSNRDEVVISEVIEKEVDCSIPLWMLHIAHELSKAGEHDKAIALLDETEQLFEGLVAYGRPLFTARAGRRAECIAAIEKNNAEYPDSPEVMLPAVEALLLVGEKVRAEKLLREALYWAGGEEGLRDQILAMLEDLLRGTPKKLKALQREELSFREMYDERSKLGVGLPPGDFVRVSHTPHVREIPKIGRNAPCPCGSGKKYKRCCARK